MQYTGALARSFVLGDQRMYYGYGYGYPGVGSLLLLVADVWAIVNIFQSTAATDRKVIWTVLVILLPLLGFLIWLFFGPRTNKS
jgi:hypothetical protein